MALPPQPREGAAGFDQLIVTPALDYLPVIEDYNLVDLLEAVQIISTPAESPLTRQSTRKPRRAAAPAPASPAGLSRLGLRQDGTGPTR
jgi:hypothetical protein